jgi:hypothetical protein
MKQDETFQAIVGRGLPHVKCGMKRDETLEVILPFRPE